MSLKFSVCSVVLCSLLFCESTLAWGQRGHHLICDIATQMVKEEQLKSFLKGRGVLLGHLCNIPDIWWRDSSANGKSGDAAHYLNPQKLGLRVEEVPLDYSALFAMKFKTPEGEKTAQDIDLAENLGSIWWRANQFFEESVKWGTTAKTSPVPSREEQQKEDHPFNFAVYEMLNSMGFLGHFVGDMGQPYHSDADYDGWAAGHGGIHAYYETQSVDELSPSVLMKILDSAKKEKPFPLVKGSSPALQVMREISIRSTKEKSEIEKRDPILPDPSKIKLLEAGVRLPPKRESAAVGAKKFESLIVKQMGRSASALALLWDESYRRAGRPDLSAYRSYRYPLKPLFVPPDYLPRLKK